MDLEVYPTKRFVFDSVFHVSSRFRPLVAKPKKGVWLAEPRSIGVAKGNYSTLHEVNDFLPEHRDVLDAIAERIAISPTLDEKVPRSYLEAKQGWDWHLWRDACNRELAVLNETGAYTVVARPAGREVMPSDWKFSVESDGVHRAKVVTSAVRDIDGISYEITNRAVPKHNMFRLVFAAAAQHAWAVHHLKFNQAYFNQDVTTEMYVDPPPGFTIPGYETGTCVLKLNKLIEGPTQTPYGRAQSIARALRLHGFFPASGGSTLFHRGQGPNLVVVAVFDEDLLIATNNIQKLDSVRGKLEAQFKMRDLKLVRKVGGINIDTHPSHVKLHLTEYIESLLRDYNMEDCKPWKLPLSDIDLNVDEFSSEPDHSLEEYRSLVAKLAYAASTVRLDIDFIVRELLRFVVSPKKKHWEAAKNVLRFLKGTKSLGIQYKRQGGITDLVGHTASTFGKREGDVFLGYVLTYSEAPIFWRCRFGEGSEELKHADALRYVIIQASWTAVIFQEIGILANCVIFSDNESAIQQESHTLPQFQPRAITGTRKRSWGKEKPNDNSLAPSIMLRQASSPNQAMILCSSQGFASQRMNCIKLNLTA